MTDSPPNAMAAIVDLTTAQEELTVAAKMQTAASTVLHGGVRKLIVVGLVVVALAIGAIVGGVVVAATMIRNTNTLVDLASTNRDNGEITRRNSEDLKRQLALIESVTGPDAQRRQAANTIDVLKRNAEETDCRSRRQQVRLPAPESTSTCVAQTPSDIYPGIAGEPSR